MMIKYSVRKSYLSIEGFFAEPAFKLFRENSDWLDDITSCLAEFCTIRGADIRVAQDTNPLSNANVEFVLHQFNGFSRLSVDKAQIALFDPHCLDLDQISHLSSSFFSAAKKVLLSSTYGLYFVNFNFHGLLENISPADHTRKFVSKLSHDNSNSAIGNSVTYYFGQNGLLRHSSVSLDMSGEFPDCVFVNIIMCFDASKISSTDLKEPAIAHSTSLLNLIGLDAEL